MLSDFVQLFYGGIMTIKSHNSEVAILDYSNKMHSLSKYSPVVYHKLEAEIKHNCKVKTYPCGSQKLTVADKPVFIESGYELNKPKETGIKKSERTEADEYRSIYESQRRAKNAVFDIVMCNDFEYFITWTLDEKVIDRSNGQIIASKLKKFLNNAVSRKELLYIIVPEYHKDNKSIHFHGLVSGNLKFVDSGHKTRNDNKTIYNMPDWRYGFSTAIPVDDNKLAVSRYITKYITKSFDKILGAYYYAGGHGLIRKPDISLCDIPFESVDSPTYTCDITNTSYKYITSENGYITPDSNAGGDNK